MIFFLYGNDFGPQQTNRVLSGFSSFRLCEFNEPMLHEEQWVNYLKKQNFSGVLIGTSRSMQGEKKEILCRKAAKKLGLTIVAIEDYPGNYQSIPHADADYLIVESQLSADLLQKRMGNQLPQTLTGASLRYDPLRENGSTIRKQYFSALKKAINRKNVLWIGQPETDIALATLKRLLPDLCQLSVNLLFKAHPRDTGYLKGEYERFFDNDSYNIIDVTNKTLSECVLLAPHFILTQFSSMAVEAGFYGIPSVHVLYPDLGGKLLMKMNGYEVPPLCKAGGSVIINKSDQQLSQLKFVLNDQSFRATLMKKFDAYFEVSKVQRFDVVEQLQMLMK